MKTKLFLIGLLFIVLQRADAKAPAYVWKTATSAGYTYRYVTNDPTHSRYYTLKNGLTVILSPISTRPRIQCYIAVKAGSKTDPADHTGLAHYLEHLMFKGTDKFGSLDWAKEKPYLDKIDDLYEQYNSTKDEAKRKEIYKEIDKTSGEAAKFAIANEYDKMMAGMGGQGSNAFTSVEETVYTEDIPATSVDKFLDLQAERFRMPIFRIFHTELEAVYEEKNRTLDNDGNKVAEAMDAAMFPNNNYGRQTTIGTVEHLKNPSLKAIKAYHDTYYVPNNMGIILSGDFNPDVMIKKVADHFSFMQSKPIPPYTFDPEKPITAPIVRDVYGPNPESVTIGFRFPGAGTRDARLLDLVGSILANGRAGLIDLDLTKKQKLLSATAGASTMKDYSSLVLRGNPVKGQSIEEVKNLLLGEVMKLKKGEFADDLIPSIVNNQRKNILERNESYLSRAGNLMDAFTSGVDWQTIVASTSELSKITKAQIVAFANKYLNENDYVVVYKHQGPDKNIVKVDKPTITPVETNAGLQSPYVKHISEMASNSVQPVWVDYNKSIQRANVGNAEMLAVQNKENALFRLYYRYEMGSWNNKLLPIATQYLQYIGTQNKTAEDYSVEFYKLASTFAITAGTDATTVSITGLQDKFAESVKLYEELLANCKADDKAWAGLKARLKRTRDNAKLNKAAISQGLISYAEYGPVNPYNYVLSDDELDAVKAQDLVDILHSLNSYKHVVLYYGPQTASLAAASLSQLHKMPASFTPYPEQHQFVKQNVTKNTVLFANYDMVQAEIYWVRAEGEYSPKRAAEIDLFNNYFGGGISSIVFQNIRESKALAYSTNAQYVAPNKKDDRDYFVAYVGTQADKLNEAIKGMNELLNDMPDAEKAFASAKSNVMNSLETGRIVQYNILLSYLANKRLGLDYDQRKSIYEEVPKLTFNDIKSFHDAALKDKPYTYCITASDKRVSDDDLKKYGELIKPSLKEIFGY